MPNSFYDHTTYPANASSLASAPMRNELDAVEEGFDKLPTLAGNASKMVAVNAGATALEAVSAATARTNVGLGNVDNTSDATKNSATATLTGKTIDLTDNTLNGTLAEFNASCSDANFASLAGVEALTNKELSTGNSISAEITNTATSAFQVPVGTAGQRPANAKGKLRYNDDTGAIEYANGTAWISPADVFGPSSATDNAIARFDATTGKLIQNSTATLDDSGNLTLPAAGKITFGDSTVLASSPVGAYKNKLINGSFDVWQRGTSFSASGYSADRWVAYFSGGTTTFGFSADSPSGILSSIYIASTASNSPQIYQRIESFNAAPLAGQKATLSFYAKQTAGSSQLTASLEYANSADNFGATTSIETFTATSLTSGWVRYSFTTASVMPAGTTNGVWVVIAKGNADTSTWLTTGVQLEAGSVATPFESRPVGMELALCQRYYEKSFNQATAPASAVGINTGEYQATATYAGAISEYFPSVRFNVLKRTSPVMTFYNPVVAGSQMRNAVRSTESTGLTTNYVSDGGFSLTCTGVAGWAVGDVVVVHWVASIEL